MEQRLEFPYQKDCVRDLNDRAKNYELCDIFLFVPLKLGLCIPSYQIPQVPLKLIITAIMPNARTIRTTLLVTLLISCIVLFSLSRMQTINACLKPIDFIIKAY